jgi:superfamily II DNA or RNA helicase
VLPDLPIKARYSTGRQNIVAEFFVPCLNESCSYDRAVGYFSSAFYALIRMPLADFARRGGTMRLICSPELSAQDIDAISSGYETRAVADAIGRDLDAVALEAVGAAATVVLGTLIAGGVLEIRIAFNRIERGIFHDKLGIFVDENRNRVSFAGSANETWAAWSGRANYEAFHAFTSWTPEGAEHVAEDVRYFERLWDNAELGLEVVAFPEVARERLVEKADPEGIESAQQELDRLLERRIVRPTLRPHQREAIDNWVAAGHRGLLEHATGSGKTITALNCMALAADEQRPVIIVVPGRVLLHQWKDEIRSFFGEEVTLLLAGDGYDEWKSGSVLRDHLQSRTHQAGIVLSTMDTASSEAFTDRCRDIPQMLLVADEVHRLGSPVRRRILQIDASWRLGLSATWQREGDDAGTAAIEDYFGVVVEPVYTLADAIRDGYLCEYRYFVHAVALDEEERAEWEALRGRIGQALGQSSGEVTENVKHLLIQRARIVKSARAKIGVAVATLAQNYQDGQAWLVYCDNVHQVAAVREACRTRGLRTSEYHTQMEGDSDAALSEFAREGGILVAINCLDEGVDIPRISHALVLASSTTRRQFIQRRGRVLRQHDSKHRAVIHDLLVDTTGFQEPASVSFMRTELSRALEFVRSAVDSSATELQLRELAAEADVDLDYDAFGHGFEDIGEDGD